MRSRLLLLAVGKVETPALGGTAPGFAISPTAVFDECLCSQE